MSTYHQNLENKMFKTASPTEHSMKWPKFYTFDLIWPQYLTFNDYYLVSYRQGVTHAYLLPKFGKKIVQNCKPNRTYHMFSNLYCPFTICLVQCCLNENLCKWNSVILFFFTILKLLFLSLLYLLEKNIKDKKKNHMHCQ